MKSIKPGRGPSGMSFVGSIAIIIFGIFWTIMATTITAHAPFGILKLFPLFGVIFIILGIVQAAYHYKNATSKDRYSIIDITNSEEEGDPSDSWIKNNFEDKVENKERENLLYNINENQQDIYKKEYNFCPYCGIRLESNFEYCPKCGKDI